MAVPCRHSATDTPDPADTVQPERSEAPFRASARLAAGQELRGVLMSPFGHKDQEKQEKNDQWRLALQVEFDRLNSLQLPQLAAEVMRRGFGPGGPGADDEDVTVGQQNINAGPTAARIAGEFEPSRGFTFPLPLAEDMKLQESIARLVCEGLQELEHASLVRAQMHTASGGMDYATPRRGRAALECGEVEGILAAASA